MASESVNKTDQHGEDLAAVFINNSEILSSTQKYYGLGFRRRVQDVRRQINYDKLLEKACKGKKLLAPVRLYGSESPPLNEVVEKIRGGCSHIDVEKYDRDKISYRETHTDTALVVDAIKLIVTLGNNINNKLQATLEEMGIKKLRHKFIVIFSGDADMIPIIDMATKYGWKVQVWAYDTFLSPVIKQLVNDSNKGKSKEGAPIEIINMEKHREELTIYEWKYDIKTSQPDVKRKYRQARLIFKQLPSPLTYETTSEQIVSTASMALRLPIQGCFIDNKKEFLIVIRVEEKMKPKDSDYKETIIYDYRRDIKDKQRDLKEIFKKKPGLRELRLSEVKAINEKDHL